MTDTLAVRLAVAALVGLAVGVEREWSGHGDHGVHPRFAGVRTFLLMGAIGGTAGALMTRGWSAVAAILVAGAALLTGTAYWSASRAGGVDAVDGTTEVAALLVIALGVLAGTGELAIAGGAGALMVLALAEKETIRRLVTRVDATELRSTFRFAVLALVVLPLLPNVSVGPFGGFNPRALWIVVLIFSGLSFAGYIARRLVGASRGYGVTGALGGMISSTAVTLQFARLSRARPDLPLALATGTVAATTVLLLRVFTVSWVLNHEVARALAPYLGPSLAVGTLFGLVLLRRARTAPHDGAVPPPERNPLALASAIQMALAFQLALTAIDFVRERFGVSGVLVSAGLLGLTDADALTLSMSRLGREPGAVPLAALAIAIGVSTNAAVKLAITLAMGRGSYRWAAAAGLGVLLATGAASIVLLAR